MSKEMNLMDIFKEQLNPHNKDRLSTCVDHEIYMESHKWSNQIPYIQFPAHWKVQIAPPSMASVVRFRVQSNKAEVSIYLDCYDLLGYYGKPYWEIHPHKGDTLRCDMEDVESLLKAIESSIKQQNK